MRVEYQHSVFINIYNIQLILEDECEHLHDALLVRLHVGDAVHHEAPDAVRTLVDSHLHRRNTFKDARCIIIIDVKCRNCAVSIHSENHRELESKMHAVHAVNLNITAKSACNARSF